MKSYQEDYEDICSKTAVTIFTFHMTGEKKPQNVLDTLKL